jgi:hypothetical protein
MCMTCGCNKAAKKSAKKAPAKKSLSPNQKKIAKMAGNPKKIGADDLAALRNKKAGK